MDPVYTNYRSSDHAKIQNITYKNYLKGHVKQIDIGYLIYLAIVKENKSKYYSINLFRYWINHIIKINHI